MQSGWNAYIKEDLIVEPTGSGLLSRLVFAVKDVFAIAGHTNSAGNPDWLDSHGPAESHAEAVELLLRQGARVKGVTITDELMFSLNGENHHYGTPVNPAAPGRIPGGSSSGSAVAVAAGLADFALGTDTGGSVRVPSSYCGLFGIRPTHGLAPIGGVIPLAASYDTVGWMARDAETLRRVGEALLGAEDGGGEFRRLIVAEDAWAIAEESCRQPLAASLAALERSMDSRRVTLAPKGLAAWAATFRRMDCGAQAALRSRHRRAVLLGGHAPAGGIRPCAARPREHSRGTGRAARRRRAARHPDGAVPGAAHRAERRRDRANAREGDAVVVHRRSRRAASGDDAGA